MKIFSLEEQEILSKNPNVTKVSSTSVGYTEAFKNYFIQERLNGKTLKEIFISKGFDPDMLGKDRIAECNRRWTKAFKERQEEGLKDHRFAENKSSKDRAASKQDPDRLSQEQINDLSKEEIIALLNTSNREKARLQRELAKRKCLDTIAKNIRKAIEGKDLTRIQRNAVIFESIHDVSKEHYGVKGALLKAFSITYSGLDKYLKSHEKRLKKATKDSQIQMRLLEIKSIGVKDKGVRQIRLEYNRLARLNGFKPISMRQTYKHCKQLEILSKARRTGPSKGIKVYLEKSEHKNLVNQVFDTRNPLYHIFADMTTVKSKTTGSKANISFAMDGSTCFILSAVVAKHMETELVIRTLDDFTEKFKDYIPEGAIFHSDQGTQYTSRDFKAAVSDKGLRQSFSKKEYCWDNAMMESRIGIIKTEADLEHFRNLEELEERLAAYLIYYNFHRPQEALGGKTPWEALCERTEARNRAEKQVAC